MHLRKNQRGAILSWLFIGALFTLCGILGVLQYRWIGEVSVADRERLRQSLHGDLNRLSEDLNSEIVAASRALLPVSTANFDGTELVTRYGQWKKWSRHAQLFGSIALAIPKDGKLELQHLDLQSGTLRAEEWPEAWNILKDRLESRLQPEGRRRRGPPVRSAIEAHLFEIPIFGSRPNTRGPQQFGRREAGWLILDLNLQYVRQSLLPELVQRHLRGDGGLEYQVDVLTRYDPPSLIYQSNPSRTTDVERTADASVGLFDPQSEQMFQRPDAQGIHNRFSERFAGGGPRILPNAGRWQMYVRNRAGSLDAVVARIRRRNLAVTGGVLLLLMAAVAALVSFTRRAQRLAALQMDFVAGVSHELRTPLAVIHGAAYNLRGVVARNPVQVEKYGALLQQESSRLRDLVEQVLRFSSAQAGRVIQEKEPLSVTTLIEQAIDSSKSQMCGADCQIEMKVESGLPMVLGDSIALKHALQNLLTNAAKYGALPPDHKGGTANWIGVSAAKAGGERHPVVEIRVADRGPGIPEDEQPHVFDPFFRGKRAIQDQIHGSGLGLNLVKKIVEAHGGTVRVESEPMKKTEFIVRLPCPSPLESPVLAEVNS